MPKKNSAGQENTITVEHAGTRIVRKPWGSRDLLPWSVIDPGDEAVGELWFQRADVTAPKSTLLLKLLFANEKLSIQVHPDDAFAHTMGLPLGKTEAWYVLSATHDAKVAAGLKRHLTTQELRTSIEDGTISDLVEWHAVQAGDVVFIPAGTIHAIGAGLVIAEIQQNTDETFRIYDYGRDRELHVDNAVAVARSEPADAPVPARRLTDARTLLVACPYFVLERIDLAPNSIAQLNADGETWLLVLEGGAEIGATNATAGVAFYLEATQAAIQAGPAGLSCLVAYVAAQSRPDLLAEHFPMQTMEVRS